MDTRHISTLVGGTNSAVAVAVARIAAGGGRMAGSVKHPVGTSDFSAYLVQAQGANPQVLGIANGGGGMIDAFKSIKEFGIDKSMKIASLLMFITDVHGMGLKDAGGLLFTTSWDWNLNDESRAFSRRFFARTGRMPTDVRAAPGDPHQERNR